MLRLFTYMLNHTCCSLWLYHSIIAGYAIVCKPLLLFWKALALSYDHKFSTSDLLHVPTSAGQYTVCTSIPSVPVYHGMRFIPAWRYAFWAHTGILWYEIHTSIRQYLPRVRAKMATVTIDASTNERRVCDI